MDIVLGVSMAPTIVRIVLVEGENADGVTVEEDNFDVVAADEAATSGAPQQVIAAILGTREGAAEGGYRLVSTGVTWTEPTEIGALRDALAFCEIRSVMLVSPLLAAAALTQTVGDAMDYEYTALLFVEPGSATLAVVKTNDGSIVDLYRQRVHCAGRGAEAATDLAAMVSAVDGLEARPDGVFIVGCGVDIVPHQAAIGRDGLDSGERTRGTGHGARPWSGARVGKRAAVRIVDRCAGLRTGSEYR